MFNVATEFRWSNEEQRLMGVRTQSKEQRNSRETAELAIRSSPIKVRAKLA